MEKGQKEAGFCWLDGIFHREDKLPIDAEILHNGLLISEVIRTRGTRLAFFSQHFEHLHSRLNVLGINLPDMMNAGEMHRQAVDLINKNRYFGGNRLQITIISGSDPATSHCLLQCSTLEHPTYVLNRKGLVVGLYDDLNIPLHRLTEWFSRPPLVAFLARRFRSARGFDDCILYNQRGHIAGSLDSTIFFRIRDKLHTAPLRDGAMRCVMRDLVMSLLAAAGDPVNDQISLRSLDAEKAEEIFLVNAVDGIRWVGAMERYRYFNHTGPRLVNMLNEKAFGST